MAPRSCRHAVSGARCSGVARKKTTLTRAFIDLGTSSSHAPSTEVLSRPPRPVEQTTVEAVTVRADSGGAAFAELRRLTGITWDQLARLFKVSRRSVHFWASGKSMNQSNEEHLRRLLAVIRKIDRGSASANRAALLAVHEDGSIPFDLLVAEQYERVAALLGPGEARRVQTPKVSPEAMSPRAPPPPEELVDALQDRIHPASGRLLTANPVRVPWKK